MYFKAKKIVPYYECDVNNNLKVSAVLRMMQQTSSEHLESISVPIEQLFAENMAFLLTKTRLKIHRIPKSSDEIFIGTAAIQTKGPRFYREFTVEDGEGNHYMDALTIWILVEPDSRKIIRPKDYPHDLPFVDSITQGAITENTPPKVGEQVASWQEKFKIAYSLLDVNNHVNNSFYADFVCDCLPYDELVKDGVDTITVCYQQEALREDLLEISRYDFGDSSYVITGNHARGNCFEAHVTMKKTDNRSKE